MYKTEKEIKEMKKDIEILRKKSKSKKALKEENKKQRVFVPRPTGTQTHKTDKNYDRKSMKKDLRKRLTNND